jgi:hypothetical protein
MAAIAQEFCPESRAYRDEADKWFASDIEENMPQGGDCLDLAGLGINTRESLFRKSRRGGKHICVERDTDIYNKMSDLSNGNSQLHRGNFWDIWEQQKVKPAILLYCGTRTLKSICKEEGFRDHLKAAIRQSNHKKMAIQITYSVRGEAEESRRMYMRSIIDAITNSGKNIELSRHFEWGEPGASLWKVRNQPMGSILIIVGGTRTTKFRWAPHRLLHEESARGLVLIALHNLGYASTKKIFQTSGLPNTQRCNISTYLSQIQELGGALKVRHGRWKKFKCLEFFEESSEAIFIRDWLFEELTH